MKFHFWNFFFLIFYVAVAWVGYVWLEERAYLLPLIPLEDFVLMALAVQRLTRLFAYDHVLDWFRNWFKGHDERSLLGTMGALLNCPWCTGLWFALVMVFFYFLTPITWYAILVLALGSVGSFLQVLFNWMRWNAEYRKQKVQGFER